ncbi:class I adenylate-forming enzyme family protein [Oceanobacillus salinisoli]|uniref:class I adenylate-forming enzyme family protein n=1 Tax=Oceanobacillus salinisoli TaxID=2678611 RepID=UPI0012E13F5D|nr:class I adenylate-forming enzyme family protein [Oceanobacillus salinisoli]
MSTFYDWIFHRNTTDKSKVLLADENKECTLGDIEKKTDFFLNLLKKEGDLKGKKVVLIVPSILPHISLFLAVNRLGGTVIPLSWQLRSKDLTDILSLLDSHILFTVETYHNFNFLKVLKDWAISTNKHTVIYGTVEYQEWNRNVCDGMPREIEQQRIDLISCTSGSTGSPKGIMINSDAMKHWVAYLENTFEMKSSDKLMSTVPISVPYGMLLVLVALKKQHLIVVNETFDLPQMVNIFYQKGCNKIASTPSIFKAFHQFFRHLKPEIGGRIELAIMAGEVITEGFINSVSELKNVTFSNNYGLSEIGGVMFNMDMLSKQAFSVREDAQFKIVPTDSKDDGVGELVIRPPAAFHGYYRRPELTSAVLDEQGWFYTGDLVRAVGQRDLELIGRKKDMIKKGGQQVIPGEIEDILLQHPAVKNVVVVGVPHDVFGEQIVAFVQPEHLFDSNELYSACASKLAGYKVPDLIKTIDEFPIVQGKVNKVMLRKLVKEDK